MIVDYSCFQINEVSVVYKVTVASYVSAFDYFKISARFALTLLVVVKDLWIGDSKEDEALCGLSESSF